MRKKLFFILICISGFYVNAQELNCTVIVNSDLIDQTNKQIFNTLERALTDYVNKNKWTNKNYAPQERITCNMLLTVTSYDSDRFTATLQVQSGRPIFNTSYQTPVFNYQDKQFNFEYLEFQPLFYNPNTFDSNLTSVITYYIYIILGMDTDTFALNGGTDYYRQARNIVNLAQGSGYAGWQQTDGNNTRWELIDNLTSGTFKEYRMALYNYHRLGLDRMEKNALQGKTTVMGSIELLEKLVSRRPNALLLQTFFDAKSDEIRNIFSGGPKVDVVRLKNSLNKVAPFYGNVWNEIKY